MLQRFVKPRDRAQVPEMRIDVGPGEVQEGALAGPPTGAARPRLAEGTPGAG